MIVSCQQCQKVYELPSEIASNPLLDKGSRGWWLECDGCQAFWWENIPHKEHAQKKSPEISSSSQTSSDTADSENPHRSELKSDILRFDQKIVSSFSLPPEEEPYQPKMAISTAAEWPIGNGYIKTRKSTPVKRILGIIFALAFLTLTIIAIAFYLYRDGLMDITTVLSYRPPAVHTQQSSELNLKIRDVKYDVQVVGNRKTVLVIGEVQNPHKPLISIRPLQIVVWGPCKNNEANLGPKQDLCKIVSWKHEWSKSYVNPQEVMPFQTVGSINLNDDVVKVDVTLP